MNEDHIVEVYATADAFEAERLRELLAEADIQATVVGDEINQMAGSMPYGGVASPRIWVHEHDKVEAARLIQQWLTTKSDSGAVDADADDADADDRAGDEDLPVEVEGISAFGKLLMMFGLGCILTGAYFSWTNHQEANSYSGEAEGVRVEADATLQGIETSFRNAHLPVAIDAHFQYQVRNKTYSAEMIGASSAAGIPPTVTVHFKPASPRDYMLGSLPSTSLPLVFGSFFGLLVMFIVYRLN
jgi:hypothetical protein